jgi:hypothetical protein
VISVAGHREAQNAAAAAAAVTYRNQSSIKFIKI